MFIRNKAYTRSEKMVVLVKDGTFESILPII